MMPAARPRPARRFHASLLAALVAAAALLAVTAPAAAGEIEDVRFPDRIEAGDRALPLFGLGLLRYRVFFRGYVGGLYLPDDAGPNQVLEDIPKVLELSYFWDIEGRFFGQAADDLLARKLPPERVAALRGRLDRLNKLYRDVEPGDRYRLTYVPGQGTTLALNGEPLGTIPGADFAADYFGIWLGDESLNDAFRDQILSNR